MSRFSFIFLTIFMVFFMTSCSEPKEEIIPINPEDIITMAELDDYMFRDDVQYVDLRNYEASFKSGFIYSFEMIPFFDYLDFRAFDRDNTYDFEPSQILDENELYRLFDKDKAIFLYADGCVRSGYLKDMLNYLGYERVYVLGGFGEYEGIHKVLGDGTYSIGSSYYATYYDETTKLTYHMSGIMEMDKTSTSIRIDIVDENKVSLRSPNYSDEIDYNQQLTILENFIIEDIITMTELYNLLTNEEIDQYDEIEGYTLGFDDGLIHTIYILMARRN